MLHMASPSAGFGSEKSSSELVILLSVQVALAFENNGAYIALKKTKGTEIGAFNYGDFATIRNRRYEDTGTFQRDGVSERRFQGERA